MSDNNYNSDLCNNPFVALFGSISQVELYKTSVKDNATKTGMYATRICKLHSSS